MRRSELLIDLFKLRVLVLLQKELSSVSLHGGCGGGALLLPLNAKLTLSRSGCAASCLMCFHWSEHGLDVLRLCVRMNQMLPSTTLVGGKRGGDEVVGAPPRNTGRRGVGDAMPAGAVAWDCTWDEMLEGRSMVDLALLAAPASRFAALCRRHGMCEGGCGHSRAPLGIVDGRLLCDDCQGVWVAGQLWADG